MPTDPDTPAELIESIHQPWKATVAECLRRWRLLDQARRSRSYLVVHAQAGARHTLNGVGIADLSTRIA